MPRLGFGVWQLQDALAVTAVRCALDTGYRLIDTAVSYGNEEAVGRAVRDSGRARDEVFVTTKVWMHDYDRVSASVDASRRRLGLGELDLVLLHWPVPRDFERTVRAYGALSELQRSGVIRSIGVSNFSAAHVEALLAHSLPLPVVDQIEIHPLFAQRSLRERLGGMGIVPQAWSPLGSGRSDSTGPLGAAGVLRIAAAREATPAQVILAWHLRSGVGALPRTSRAARIASNYDAVKLMLSDEEFEAVDALDTGMRLGADPELVHDATFAPAARK